MYILHTSNINKIDHNIKSRCQYFTLPTIVDNEITDEISYHKIIKLLKKHLTKKSIESIRELSYYYYMNHKDSESLQKLLVSGIGSNIYS